MTLIMPDHQKVKNYLDFCRDHINHTQCACPTHMQGVLLDLYECLRRSQMKLDADGLGRFLVETIELLRYYRSRVHRVQEDEDGGYSPYHLVYGVHREAIAETDNLLSRAANWGVLGRMRDFG